MGHEPIPSGPLRAGGLPEPAGRPPQQAVLRTRRSLEQYRIEISGELTRPRLDRLVEELEKALEVGAPQVVLDLSDVEAIDRACVRMILMAHLRAGDQRQELRIVPGRESVRAALDAIAGPFLYAES